MIPAESFVLNPDYEGTLQQQIIELVTEGILSGRLLAGERMPSTRQLATQLGVSRITVTLAYTELVSNDFLASRDRSGYFVSENAPVPPDFELPPEPSEYGVDWESVIQRRFAIESPLVRPVDWRRYKYPFIYGQADATLFDHQNWRQCALKALGAREFDAMTADFYERDDERLIEFITRHILPRRGIVARSSEVLLTLGAQNALWIVAQVLLTENGKAVVENPGYLGLREIVEQAGCSLSQVDVDDAGLPPQDIPRDADVVFTTASHHCPTNATMPVERRRDLLERATRDGFVVVEDDYEFEMSFGRSPSPALKSLDRSGSVIYVGSFSKSVFPGLRLGFLVAPEPFVKEARALRGLVLRHPPGNLQRTMAYFLSLGHYDAQLRRMGAAYAERRAVMSAAITDHGLDMAAPETNGGSSFWMKAPDGVNTSDLALNLRDRGVVIEPGRAFFGKHDENHAYYRLAYSSIPPARIPEGIALIAQAVGAATR